MLIAESLVSLQARLRNVGMLYVDRDLASSLDWSGIPHGVLKSMSGRRFDAHQHTETARAVIRVTGSNAVGIRQMHRHFRWAPDAKPHQHLWKWVLDPIGKGAGREWSGSLVAKSLTRLTGGVHSTRLRTRLWFFDLADVIWAASWPWLPEWGSSDLYLALAGREPLELIADWLGSQGKIELGEALVLWHRADGAGATARRLAALAVFKAAEPLRVAAQEYIQCEGDDDSRYHAAFNVWDNWVWSGRKGPEPELPPRIASDETKAALEQLLAIGKGCPRKVSTPKLEQAMVG